MSDLKNEFVDDEVEEMDVKNIEKYYRYYVSYCKSKKKYEKKNRELLNEKARIRYAENCQNPEFVKAQNERMLSYYI